MAQKSKPTSELTNAAADLAAALQRYEDLAAEVQRGSLDSEKALGRATKAVREAQESQEQIGFKLGALVAAITGARERQQATSEALLARALVVQARVNRYEQFAEQLDELGNAAREINQLMQGVAAQRGAEAPPTTAETLAGLGVVDERIGQAIEKARALLAEAKAEDAADIALRADGIRQQMLAVRNKLRMVEKGLGGALPN